MSKSIFEKTSNKRIVEKGKFPHPICLELCNNETPPKGFEKEIIEALQSFSDENKFNHLKPHLLKQDGSLKNYFKKAKKVGCDKIYSLDVGYRHNKYRLFYCIDDKGIHKILSLASTDSH